ncbi:MAG TPA: hypothetical protein PKN44_15650 [Bacteroidales bacterium]|nr:hypothetical protein [Bacteroidales bacterium]
MLDILVRTNALGDTLWTKQIFNDRLSVSDFTEREVMLLQDEYMVAGSHKKSIDMYDLPCGFYTLQLRAGSQFLVKKTLKVQD